MFDLSQFYQMRQALYLGAEAIDPSTWGTIATTILRLDVGCLRQGGVERAQSKDHLLKNSSIWYGTSETCSTFSTSYSALGRKI